MSELFGLVLESVFGVILGLLEAVAEAWVGDFTSSDTTANRVFWCVILAALGCVIWWEVH